VHIYPLGEEFPKNGYYFKRIAGLSLIFGGLAAYIYARDPSGISIERPSNRDEFDSPYTPPTRRFESSSSDMIKPSRDPQSEIMKDLFASKSLIREQIASLSTNENPNAQLAAKILGMTLTANIPGNVRKIILRFVDNPEFLEKPVYHMANWMISRGVGRYSLDDEPAGFIIANLPQFTKDIGNLEALRTLARIRFENHSNKEAILAVFNKSLETPEFQKDFYSSLEDLKDGHTDKLRASLYIFRQAEILQLYSYPRVESLME
jgi:hypothetical protein